MLKGKLGAALVCCFVITTTAGTWAAYSYAVPAIPLLLGSPAAYQHANANRPQSSNTDAKGDRLSVAAMNDRFDSAKPQPEPAPVAFALASATSTPADLPKTRIEPRTEPRKAAATAEKPADKKRAEQQQRLLLDDAQISALRTRLNLTPTQEEFWPAVEVTLRNVVRQHARKNRKNDQRGAPQIDVNSPEVQQLISAAVPLIMRMSEPQKREVRQLARIIGLDQVASRI